MGKSLMTSVNMISIYYLLDSSCLHLNSIFQITMVCFFYLLIELIAQFEPVFVVLFQMLPVGTRQYVFSINQIILNF